MKQVIIIQKKNITLIKYLIFNVNIKLDIDSQSFVDENKEVANMLELRKLNKNLHNDLNQENLIMVKKRKI